MSSSPREGMVFKLDLHVESSVLWPAVISFTVVAAVVGALLVARSGNKAAKARHLLENAGQAGSRLLNQDGHAVRRSTR